MRQPSAIFRSIALISAFALLFFSFLNAQVTTGTIQHDGLQRDYRLFVPSNTTEARPLVFNFHGFTSNAFEQEFYSAMNVVADTADFYVCYPNGIGAAWNVGWDFGSTADDVGFVENLIDSLSANYNIDPNRIYACGMSNGGFMSYLLACELNDQIAAIASVTGSMAPQYTCSPGIEVPVLEIHGTSDNVVGYNGTTNVGIPIDDVLSFWVNNNGCDQMPTIEELPNTNTADQSTVTKFTFNNCTDGQAVLHYRVNQGGHTWPGGLIDLPGNGNTNRDIFASVEIWHFFRRFTLDDQPSAAFSPISPIEVSVFPNPTLGQVQIKTANKKVDVRVYDTFGRLVLQQKNTSNPGLDLSAQPAGIYLLDVQAFNWRKTIRLVKTQAL